MGDGRQSKSYVLVTDVVAAVLAAVDAADAAVPAPTTSPPATTSPSARSSRWRSRRSVSTRLGPTSATAPEPRGWKGDVPVVRIATERIRRLGWAPSGGSREALRASMTAMLADLEAGVGS